MNGAVGSRGFSLVEVMVSIMLTLIILGPLFGLLAGGQQAFRTQPQVTDLQQNARAILDMVARDALQAGAGLPPEFPAITPPSVDPAVGDQNPDVIEIIGGIQYPGVFSPGPAPSSSRPVRTQSWTAVELEGCPSVPCTNIQAGDLVVVYTAEPEQPHAAHIYWNVGYVQVDPNASNPPVVRLGDIPPVGARGGPVPAPYKNAVGDPGLTRRRLLVVPVTVVRYFARPDTSGFFAGPPNFLMRQVNFGKPSPVGTVDDFQISYLMGNNPPAERPNPPPPVPAGVLLEASFVISGIRITVTGRSLAQNLVGARRGTSGSFIRRTFSSNVHPRNISAGLAERTLWNPAGPAYQ